MAPSLLQHQGHLSPAEAMELAQQAPTILGNNPNAFSSSPLVALFSAKETPELWIVYENVMLACLRVGDDSSAHQFLERLVRRFGDQNERVMALKGLVRETEAAHSGELEEVLKEYDQILAGVGDGGTNIPIAKRRVAVARSLGKTTDAIASLVSLLEYSPTDGEAWAELSDLYLSQGMYAQAIYALEEVMVLSPNAWNMHARFGEVLYMAASTAGSEGQGLKYLTESLKRFCRSIELCDDYLRGFHGLKMVSDKLLGESKTFKPSKNSDDGLELPERATIEALNAKATEKLGEIVRRYSAKDPNWQGYDALEIAAARDLLGTAAKEVVR